MAKAEGTSLLETPTYYVVAVLLTIVVFSSVFDKLLHILKHYFKKHGKLGLLAALDAMSMEIMLLGAISLLLLIVEDKITSICFNRDLNQSWTMLYRVRGCPCCLKDTARVTNCFLHERKCGPSACNCENGNPMCLANYTEDSVAACQAGDDLKYKQCNYRHGYRPFITKQALHQIHIMVFICALTHIFVSILVLILSDLRVREWRSWRQAEDDHIAQVNKVLDEEERICRIKEGRAYMQNKEGQDVEIDPAIGLQIARLVVFDNEGDEEGGRYVRNQLAPVFSGRDFEFEEETRRESVDKDGSFRLGRVLSRPMPHALRSPSFRSHQPRKGPVMEVVKSFLRQFTISVVTFEEFAVMRASFVLTHQLDGRFDFVSYVLDRTQDDFAEVVGLGIGSWIQTCIFFLLAGTVGWPALWYSLAMLAILMVLNTKLISIVRTVTRDGTVHHLRPNYFWFKRPWLMLSIIKLLLFLASLNIGTVLFFLIDYGPHSCFFTSDLLAGIIGGQWWEPVLASAVVILGLGLETLPLYSMAVQMGQKFKDYKELEGIEAHFRSLPRPDNSEIVVQSFTHTSMQKMKQALTKTSMSLHETLRASNLVAGKTAESMAPSGGEEQSESSSGSVTPRSDSMTSSRSDQKKGSKQKHRSRSRVRKAGHKLKGLGSDSSLNRSVSPSTAKRVSSGWLIGMVPQVPTRGAVSPSSGSDKPLVFHDAQIRHSGNSSGSLASSRIGFTGAPVVGDTVGTQPVKPALGATSGPVQACGEPSTGFRKVASAIELGESESSLAVTERSALSYSSKAAGSKNAVTFWSNASPSRFAVTSAWSVLGGNSRSDGGASALRQPAGAQHAPRPSTRRATAKSKAGGVPQPESGLDPGPAATTREAGEASRSLQTRPLRSDIAPIRERPGVVFWDHVKAAAVHDADPGGTGRIQVEVHGGELLSGAAYPGQVNPLHAQLSRGKSAEVPRSPFLDAQSDVPVPLSRSRIASRSRMSEHESGEGSDLSNPSSSGSQAHGVVREGSSSRTPSMSEKRHSRRPSYVELCQAVASGASDLQSAVAGEGLDADGDGIMEAGEVWLPSSEASNLSQR